MRSQRYRAWLFLHPDLDVPEAFAGLSLSRTGGIEMAEDRGSVRQAILLLLTTLPGERVMRPDYGCLLHKLVFAPNDDTTAGLAIHYVETALKRWESRIDILRVDASRNQEDPGRLDIMLEYRVRATQAVDGLTFSMTLSGEQI
jgi:uncharacterized protein